MGVVASVKGLCRVILPQSTHDIVFHNISAEFVPAQLHEDNTFSIIRALVSFIVGQKVDFNYPLDLPKATQFQQAVWQATCSISYGETRSYSWVAQEAGYPGAYRATGRVLAHNPTPIVIPCHRVVARDGSLHGFQGGLEMKQRLILLEQNQQEG